YTILGVIPASIWILVIQAGVLLVSARIIFYALLTELPFPLVEMLSSLKSEGKTNALDFSFDFTREATVWSGVIAMALYHTTVYGANQMMVQRTLAAKNIGDAKKSYLMMGFAAFFIYFLFMFLGVLFYGYYDGIEFENSNTIILAFASDYALPGLMGVIAAAVIAAAMSSLDSSLNSMATVSTVDFYQRFFRPGRSSAHYLKTSRVFTVIWAAAIIGPAIALSRSEGSILQTLSQLGSYFVGAKLSMYGLGFFSKHASERGVLVGVVVGFMVVWGVAAFTDISWPWYCLIGGVVNVAVSLPASLLLDGRQSGYSIYTVRGQLKQHMERSLPLKEGNWYLVPGRVDRVCYLLLAFFVLTLLFLALFERLIP
ncbi:MAG: sodium transporter, partial [Gammaproteobacteria bacterium]|nr:sodium transporter [Gammaproteobacteria bacterium]